MNNTNPSFAHLRHLFTLVTVCFAALSLTGCVTRTLEQRTLKSYVLGVERVSNVGAAFLVDQQGTVTKVKEWVGLLNAPGGWATNHVYSSDFLRHELIYSGISGSTISVAYREFRNNTAAPSFYQSLNYDLQTKKDIQFQNFQIRVLAADNQTIRFVVVNDGSAEQAKLESILVEKKGRIGLAVDDNGLISAVVSGSGGEKAGIKIGDRIVKIDGNGLPVGVPAIVEQLVGERGSQVVLTVVRNEQELTFTIIRK